MNQPFSERLREAISGYNIQEFAKKCGVSEGTIRAYLRGKSEPGLSILIKISRESRKKIEWLATGNATSTSNGGEDFRFIIDAQKNLLAHQEKEIARLSEEMVHLKSLLSPPAGSPSLSAERRKSIEDAIEVANFGEKQKKGSLMAKNTPIGHFRLHKNAKTNVISQVFMA